jgi:pyruvate/2-oxoacid:ferredoxin oxidoreductase alpha subunit
MTSKIASDKPGSFALFNGDEAVARGAVEANIKVAASYPGTPATEILETIHDKSPSKVTLAEQWLCNRQP